MYKKFTDSVMKICLYLLNYKDKEVRTTCEKAKPVRSNTSHLAAPRVTPELVFGFRGVVLGVVVVVVVVVVVDNCRSIGDTDLKALTRPCPKNGFGN